MSFLLLSGSDVDVAVADAPEASPSDIPAGMAARLKLAGLLAVVAVG